MLETILDTYGLAHTPKPFGTGLINHTWIIEDAAGRFILQRINDNIFRNPLDIAHNIRRIGSYLKDHYPDYLYVMPVVNNRQQDMIHIVGEGYFRLFPFVKNSHTIDVVTTPAQAYEAARQFGRFTKLLSHFPTADLKITLPDFHNLTLRYEQFETAVSTGNRERILRTAETITYLQSKRDIVTTSEQIARNRAFRKRVTHHDTKISNVLFDSNNKGLCVIDLDTVMQGYFISDVGDMLRTYLSPVSEEESDLTKVEVRTEFFAAVAAGYLGEMQGEFSAEERAHFVYAGKFMIYMQALRFLADYLNDDVYYGSAYDEQNLYRANNQVQLLKKLIETEPELHEVLAALS